MDQVKSKLAWDAIERAKAEEAGEWIPAREFLPDVGERVEVRHEGNHSYDCHGYVDSSGTWQCENFFVLPGGPTGAMLVADPTHWRLSEREKNHG